MAERVCIKPLTPVTGRPYRCFADRLNWFDRNLGRGTGTTTAPRTRASCRYSAARLLHKRQELSAGIEHTAD
jgi:hypothetical protein